MNPEQSRKTEEALKGEKLKSGELAQLAGGAAQRGSGYCPYTPDRTCHTDKGGWDDSEVCRECGWRAW